MRKKSWENLTDTDLLEMIRNGESRVDIANRYGVSKYVSVRPEQIAEA